MRCICTLGKWLLLFFSCRWNWYHRGWINSGRSHVTSTNSLEQHCKSATCGTKNRRRTHEPVILSVRKNTYVPAYNRVHAARPVRSLLLRSSITRRRIERLCGASYVISKCFEKTTVWYDTFTKENITLLKFVRQDKCYSARQLLNEFYYGQWPVYHSI